MQGYYIYTEFNISLGGGAVFHLHRIIGEAQFRFLIRYRLVVRKMTQLVHV